jgi:hypothetical protein
MREIIHNLEFRKRNIFYAFDRLFIFSMFQNTDIGICFSYYIFFREFVYRLYLIKLNSLQEKVVGTTKQKGKNKEENPP